MRSVVGKADHVEDENQTNEGREVSVEANRPLHSLLDKLRAIPKAPSDRKEYRVLVVDDSVLPRVAARTMLGTAAGLRRVAEASSAWEALQAMATLKAALVLMQVDSH